MKDAIFSLFSSTLGASRVNRIVAKLFAQAVNSANTEAEIQTLCNLAAGLVNEAEDKKRKVNSAKTAIPVIKSYKANAEAMSVQIMPAKGVWFDSPDFESKVPGMISKEEQQYYLYLGQFYQGKGEVVEIGPWLGRSTTFICQGLMGNPAFADRKMQVYDDFVWRPSWMDLYVSDAEKQGPYTDFRGLFNKYTSAISDKIETYKQKFSVYDGNDNIPDMTWNGKKIEIIYADCGRMMETNKKWYDLLKPFFIPGVTLIVLQDWRLHREIPTQWYNQTKEFTDSLAHELIQVHEITLGGISMFLYQPKVVA